MSATLEHVTKKNRPELTAEQRAAGELVRQAREQGLSLTGPDGLLKQPTRQVLETALNQEMTSLRRFLVTALGYSRGADSGLFAWDGSWDDPPNNPSAAGATSAISRAIGAASAFLA